MLIPIYAHIFSTLAQQTSILYIVELSSGGKSAENLYEYSYITDILLRIMHYQ